MEKTKTEKPRAGSARAYIDLSLLSITDDPVQLSRPPVKYHYDELFEKLGEGQRLKCPGDLAHSISNTLRLYLKRNGVDAKVRSCSNYKKDGLGGVWWSKQ